MNHKNIDILSLYSLVYVEFIPRVKSNSFNYILYDERAKDTR